MLPPFDAQSSVLFGLAKLGKGGSGIRTRGILGSGCYNQLKTGWILHAAAGRQTSIWVTELEPTGPCASRFWQTCAVHRAERIRSGGWQVHEFSGLVSRALDGVKPLNLRIFSERLTFAEGAQSKKPRSPPFSPEVPVTSRPSRCGEDSHLPADEHAQRTREALSPVIGERAIAVGTCFSRPCHQWQAPRG